MDQRLSHRRFAAGVHQQGAVSQGDQRPQRLGLARKQRRGPNTAEALTAGVDSITGADGPWHLGDQQGHQLIHKFQLGSSGMPTWKAGQGAAQ